MNADQPCDEPCPKCNHANDDHDRESWFDEEGIEGMTCSECVSPNVCRWWTWDWDEVVSDEAAWEGEQSTWADRINAVAAAESDDELLTKYGRHVCGAPNIVHASESNGTMHLSMTCRLGDACPGIRLV